MKSILQAALFGILLTGVSVTPLSAVDAKAWTDPVLAAKENPDFSLQGEYITPTDSKHEGKIAAQVVALGGGKFKLVRYTGGLPGAGWDGHNIHVLSGELHDGAASFKESVGEEVLTLAHSKIQSSMSGEAERVERKSPTEGAAAPAGATVLFDGTEASLKNWAKGALDGDLLKQGTQTAAEFGSFKLHIEFRVPFKPDVFPGNQDRGNSGVYIHDRYEVQVIDSFGLPYFHQPEAEWAKAFNSDFGVKPPSERTQWLGSLYHFKAPPVNMAFPPLAWQTYDIDFTAPKVDASGKKTANARITVILNGVKLHDNVELPQGTGAAAKKPEMAKGPIVLQEHHNAVRFRNIWIVAKD